ncbi:hypothetical protein N0V85_003471 [Neurospora sp. IMI 360204]|nr:hypothetical protein N0V85_003471 [Neurospora sp. IMI 360204]
MDVLRFVLNCPEPYCWQKALLPSELRTIYQHSYAIRACDPNDSKSRSPFCIFCFRDFNQVDGFEWCTKCKRESHRVCSWTAAQLRTPTSRGTCWICCENVEWNIEKFYWNDRVLPAAPRTAPAVPAQIGPAAGAIQENIQRKEPEDKQPNNNTPSTSRRQPSSLPSSSSSTNNPSSLKIKLRVPSLAHRRGQLPRESETIASQAQRESRPLNTSVQADESIPLPGNPALIWQETQKEREKQQQEKERQQAALPKPSPALGHALPTLNSGGGKPSEVAITPNAASIPAGDHTSTRASSSAAETPASAAITATPQHNQAGTTSIPAHDPSVAGVIPQKHRIGVEIASRTEPTAATSSQHTISTPANNPASASAPVPPDHSASAPTPAPSGTHTSIDHTKAMELVQECSRLAKKSVQIRKKSEREAKLMEKKHRRELKKITKMEKKHRRELKKTKRKSKQEVKRLEKNIERLEKDVLKALARPEVAEGAAAWEKVRLLFEYYASEKYRRHPTFSHIGSMKRLKKKD